MSDRMISATVRSGLAFINLRGDADDEHARTALEAAIGQPLPVAANTQFRDALEVYWQGPDEWLLVCEEQQRLALLRDLGAADAAHIAVNDVSGGYIAMQLAGPSVPDLFAKGCTLDFHPTVFGEGSCAQTGLAKAPVMISLRNNVPTFDLFVRRSFSSYLRDWLQHAGAEFPIEFS